MREAFIDYHMTGERHSGYGTPPPGRSAADDAYDLALATKAAKEDNAGVCDRCGADVLWASTSRGKTIPFDAQESSAGKRWRLKPQGRHLAADPVRLDDRFASGHRCHFDTCEAK